MSTDQDLHTKIEEQGQSGRSDVIIELECDTAELMWPWRGQMILNMLCVPERLVTP